MIDPMEALQKLPKLPTSLISSASKSASKAIPTSLPTINPGTTPEYQKATHVGTQTLWYDSSDHAAATFC